MFLRNPLLVTVLVLLAASFTPARGFDGSHDLICSAIEATTCTKAVGAGSHCISGTANESNVPNFITLRFKEREIELRYTGREKKTVTFSEVQRHRQGIAVQGVLLDEGVWTVVVLPKRGNMQAAGMEPMMNYFLYGTCIPLD